MVGMLRPIMRVIAAAALRDQTWAGARVYDTDNRPFAEAILEQQNIKALPYITVFTENDTRRSIEIANSLYTPEGRTLQLSIETGVASVVRIHENAPGMPGASGASGASGPGQLVLKFEPSDQAMEIAVDIIEGQIIAALFGNPRSKWGDLFKQMFRVMSTDSRRGASSTRGTKYAARRMTFTLQPNVYDLVPGVLVQEGHIIHTFLKEIDNSPEAGFDDAAVIIRTMLETVAAPTWRQAQAYLGLDTAAIQTLAVPGTLLPVPDMEVPPLDYSDRANEFAPLLRTISTDEPPPEGMERIRRFADAVVPTSPPPSPPPVIPLATPLTILGSGLLEWWDFGDAATITLNSGNSASVIGKKIGVLFENATSSEQPIWSATARNGKGGIVCDGTRRLLFNDVRLPACSGMGIAGYNGQPSGTQSWAWSLGGPNAFQTCRCIARSADYDDGGGIGRTSHYNFSDQFYDSGTNVWGGTDKFMLYARSNSGPSGNTDDTFLYKNGNAADAWVPCAQLGISNNIGSIGGNDDAPSFIGVYQDLFLITYGTILTTVQNGLLAGWESWKNGKAGSNLASDHPYKTRAPTEADI